MGIYSKYENSSVFHPSHHFQIPQCLPEEPKKYASQNDTRDFAKVDQIFGSLQFAEDKKITIYKILAAILHLGNIEFGNNGPDDEIHIIEATEHHIRIAADLLNVPANELENALLYHIMHVHGSQIK